MNDLNLESYGVQEMNVEETKDVNGGIPYLAILTVMIYVYNNYDDFAAGAYFGDTHPAISVISTQCFY